VKIGYPSRIKKRRINATTITAKKAVKKKKDLIACSRRRESRAMPAEVLAPRIS
jgi:hypothetical protein